MREIQVAGSACRVLRRYPKWGNGRNTAAGILAGRHGENRLAYPLCALCALWQRGWFSFAYLCVERSCGRPSVGWFLCSTQHPPLAFLWFSTANGLAFHCLEPVLELYTIFTSLVLRFQSADTSPDGHNVGVFDAPKMKPGTKCPRLFFQHH